MTLEELAIKYSCDKYYGHSYIHLYEELLAKKQVRSLLEIGIGNEKLMAPLVPKYIHGASLKMWEEYLPDAEIYACDILPETLINEGRIHSTVCDQYDTASIRDMLHTFRRSNFDVIIDDGCHTTLAQVISFMNLYPRLSYGGIYIIEDVGYPEVLNKAIDGEVHIFRKQGRWDDVAVVKMGKP